MVTSTRSRSCRRASSSCRLRQTHPRASWRARPCRRRLNRAWRPSTRRVRKLSLDRRQRRPRLVRAMARASRSPQASTRQRGPKQRPERTLLPSRQRVSQRRPRKLPQRFRSRPTPPPNRRSTNRAVQPPRRRRPGFPRRLWTRLPCPRRRSGRSSRGGRCPSPRSSSCSPWRPSPCRCGLGQSNRRRRARCRSCGRYPRPPWHRRLARRALRPRRSPPRCVAVESFHGPDRPLGRPSEAAVVTRSL